MITDNADFSYWCGREFFVGVALAVDVEATLLWYLKFETVAFRALYGYPGFEEWE